MKHTKLILTFLLFTFFSTNLLAQVNQEWVAFYNQFLFREDQVHDMVIDSLGNVYVTGVGNASWGAGNADYATVKYDANGQLKWVRTYDGPPDPLKPDIAYSIVVDNTGNVYITGKSRGGQYNRYEIATIKYSSSGTQLWVARYSGSAHYSDGGESIAVDEFGNVYITGYCSEENYLDYVTIKYSPSGTQLWVATYDGTAHGRDVANMIKIGKDGYIYVTGESDGIGSGEDYVTIKYDTSGTQMWIERYNGIGNSYDRAMCIGIDDSNNVYVTGGSYGFNSNFDCLTIKYDTNGTEKWVSRYSSPALGLEGLYRLAFDKQGNVYATGQSDLNYITIKYDTFGNTIWLNTYNGPGNGGDYSYSIAVDDSGNAYVTGESFISLSPPFWDCCTIKYDSSGNQKWLIRYDGTLSDGDVGYRIAVSQNGCVYVAGTTMNSSLDFLIIKYNQNPSQISILGNLLPNQFLLSQNYPNPFNPTTNIKFDIPKSSIIRIIIYNTLGKEVTTLVNEKLNAGSYEVDWDATDYPSGVYIYKLHTNDFIDVKKMVLVK